MAATMVQSARGDPHSRGPGEIEERTVMHSDNGLPWGLTVVEQANSVEFALRMMGLTSNFGQFVVLCGHGSATDNNPYASALDCGACGGKHGDPNARAFANMANKPEVRRLLKERGLDVPDDTWFLPAKHITTSGRVVFFDIDDVPASHREELRIMMQDVEKAGAQDALERRGRLPVRPEGRRPKRLGGTSPIAPSIGPTCVRNGDSRPAPSSSSAGEIFPADSTSAAGSL